MIVIPNEKLLAVAKDAGFFESFRIADDVLRQGVQGISDIITIPGIINRDFADVKTTMAGMGHAVMGTAVRSGANRAIEAAQAAMASPLLEAGAIDGARGILINITGSSSLKLSEVNEASSLIQSAAHEDANIIFGAVLDEKMGEEVKITVIATGFRDQMPERRARMLSVEEAPVVSVPVVAVPSRRPELAQRESRRARSAPDPPRFMSQDEDEEAETAERTKRSSSRPLRRPSPPPLPLRPRPRWRSRRTDLKRSRKRWPCRPAPQFEELAEEPRTLRCRRDYASDFGEGVSVDGHVGRSTVPSPSPSLFPETDEEEQRDLDVPAFMRRSQF